MSLFAPSGGKAAKFAEPGATITGRIASQPFEKQATKFGSQEPDFWPNGDPKMQIVVPLEATNAPLEDSNDDGERTIYVSSGKMKRAISDAIRNAGVTDVAIGGTLTVTFTGYDPESKNPANPAKLYAAQYTPPATGFATSAPTPAVPAVPGAPAAPAAQVPAQPTPATPAPVAAPAPAAATPTVPGVTEEIKQKAHQLFTLNLPIESVAAALGIPTETVQQLHAERPF